jgi:23S rRNA (guanosine2251-2'-O)-methyltransferase
LLLDQIQDPHNLGACIRSADAFGADAVILPKHGSAPLSAVALKAASGATETTPICHVSNLVQCIETLQQAGVWVLGAEMETDATLFNTTLTGPLAWVLGNEGKGLRRLTRERCDALVAIPMVGAVESLNVSVATAVCLYATQAARAKSSA